MLRHPAAILLFYAVGTVMAQSAPVQHHSKRRLVLSTVGGAAAGAAIGLFAIPYDAVASQDRAARRLRVAGVYSLLGGTLAAALAVRSQPAAAMPHRFFLDRWNTPLLLGMGAVQVLDFTSTRYFRQRGKNELLLTNGLVDNRPALVATEAAAVGAGIGLAYLLHRSGHHKLERLFSAGYIGFGTASAIANYRYPTSGRALFG